MADEKKNDEEPRGQGPIPGHEEPHAEGAPAGEKAAAAPETQAGPAVQPVVADAAARAAAGGRSDRGGAGPAVADAAAQPAAGQPPAAPPPPPPGPPPPQEGGGDRGGRLITLTASRTVVQMVVVGLLVILAMFFIWIIARDVSRTASLEFLRGLITLLFSVGTIVTAVMLVFAAIYQEPDPTANETLEARFNRGKEVLSLLIGIFGTILGFYFGSGNDDAMRRRALTALEGLGGEVIDDTVYLDKPTVHDADLFNLRRLPKVRTLHLDFSAITDDGLIYLYDLKDLELLTVRRTNLHKEAVQSLIDNSPKTVRGIPNSRSFPRPRSFPPAPRGSRASPPPTPPPQPPPQPPAAPTSGSTPAAGKAATAPPPEPVVPKDQ